MGSTLLPAQPILIHSECTKDIVYTPRWLSKAIVETLSPAGHILDPCRGDGAFYDFFPTAWRSYCEIDEGIDFFAWDEPVDWVIGNPPYSNLLGWFRHAFTISQRVAYLVPLHRVMGSEKFIRDVALYGGLSSVIIVGTGTTAGFPFGHCLAVVVYTRGYSGGTDWITMKR